MSSEPLPSATTVVVRDASEGLEVLLLQRNRDRAPWVFPGGKVDAADRANPGGSDALDAAVRCAGVREAREEAGLSLDAAALTPISRWITPKLAPKRFDTWFFLASVAPDAPVRVDGGEIRGHRWLRPALALEAHARRELRLAPPTYVTVTWLVAHADTARAHRELSRGPFLTFRPRICPLPDGACMLYPGDAGYEASDPDLAGARHRLWTLPDGWRYERS